MSFYRIQPGTLRRRSARRVRGWRVRPGRWGVQPGRSRNAAPAPVAVPVATPVAVAPRLERAPRDRASARVREAGGPIDEASYACDCGFVFSAPVSTTVVCPHCGATQAW
jgi:hypothetical protein